MSEAKTYVDCGHQEWHSGHCSVITCRYYISRCAFHSSAQSGSACNLMSHSEWLVEQYSEVTFHVIVVARVPEQAYYLAEHELLSEYPNVAGLVFDFTDLVERVPGYLWQASEGAEFVAIRRLRGVPAWKS